MRDRCPAAASTSAKVSRSRSGSRRWLQAEAIDLTHEGLGLRCVLAHRRMMPAVGEVVTVRYTGRGGSGARQQAVVRHVGSLQTGRGAPAPRALARPRRRPGSPASIGARAPLPVPGGAAGVRHRGVPVVLPRAPALPDPRGRRRRDDAEDRRTPIRRCCPGGARLRPAPRVHRASSRPRAVTSVRRDDANGGFEVGVAWVDPPRALLNALSRYLLAGDDTPDARDAARRRPRRPQRRARGDLRLRHVGAPTTRRSSRCACMPIRRRATSTTRRSPTCARRSTRTRATSPAGSAGGSSATSASSSSTAIPAQPVRLARRPRGPAVALGGRLRRGAAPARRIRTSSAPACSSR